MGVPGKDYAANSVSPASFPDLAAKMKADGYPPLEKVDTGKSGEGWIAGYFYGPGTHDGAFVAYRRVAAKGSDGTDIPRKTYPVTIPTA